MRNDVPDKVLVCLKDTTSNFICDAELPSQMLVKNLSIGLLRLLRASEPEKYADCTDMSIEFRGRKLENNQTLASVGAWSGSELVIRAIRRNSYWGY